MTFLKKGLIKSKPSGGKKKKPPTHLGFTLEELCGKQ